MVAWLVGIESQVTVRSTVGRCMCARPKAFVSCCSFRVNCIALLVAQGRPMSKAASLP